MRFLRTSLLDMQRNEEITHGFNGVVSLSEGQQHSAYSISNSFYKRFSVMFSNYNEGELQNIQLLTLDF